MGQCDDPKKWVDETKPNLSRVYNYGMRGKDNYPPDRAMADAIMSLSPHLAEIALQNKHFLNRAILEVAKSGVSQFVDIGAGIPLLNLPNTHTIALASNENARCVYVDNDFSAVTHLQGQVAMPPQVIGMLGDLRDPRRILTSHAFNACIDLGRPVAVVLGAVLHLLPDPEAREAVEYIKRGLAPGSYLIISHGTADKADPDVVDKIQEIYTLELQPITLRPRDEVTRFLDGWKILEPGVVDINKWRPTQKIGDPLSLYGAVARKP